MSLNIHQKISLAFAIMILIFSMYDVLFHLLLGIAHILFETAEFVLDHLIESLFEIGNRETEIVVFYILISAISGGVYKLYCLLPRWKDQCKQRLERQKTETLMQWQGLSMLEKMAWWIFLITLIFWFFLS